MSTQPRCWGFFWFFHVPLKRTALPVNCARVSAEGGQAVVRFQWMKQFLESQIQLKEGDRPWPRPSLDGGDKEAAAEFRFSFRSPVGFFLLRWKILSINVCYLRLWPFVCASVSYTNATVLCRRGTRSLLMQATNGRELFHCIRAPSVARFELTSNFLRI